MAFLDVQKVLYVLSSMTIEENYYNVSLLRVLGYNQKEISSLILNTYSMFSKLFFVISTFISIKLVDFMMKYLATNFNMVIPMEYKFYHLIIGLILVEIIFLISSYSSKKKIEKISLQEILKDYRD